MIARLLRIATLALLLLTALARTARADERLFLYELDVTPDATGGRARFALALHYVAPPGLPKSVGFKYVGSASIDRVAVHDGDGAHLPFRYAREKKSGEMLIEFDVPRPGIPGQEQLVVVEFDQDLDRTCGFTSCDARVSWAHKFKIPVEKMRVRVHGAGVADAQGFTCEGRGDARVCSRETPSAEPVELTFVAPSGNALAASLAGLVVALTFGVVLLRSALARAHATALRLRGVIPPSPVAYPEPTGYRAPPPIPEAGTVEPVLPDDEAKLLARRRRTMIVASSAALVWNAALLRTSWPAPGSLAVGVVLVALAASLYTLDRDAGFWLLFGPFLAPLGGFLLGPAGAALAAHVGALFHVFAVVASNVGGELRSINWATASSSSSSSWSSSSSSCSSSSSSSSSCSSGSSCGGGGGGGGCGGGGGGGGCGG